MSFFLFISFFVATQTTNASSRTLYTEKISFQAFLFRVFIRNYEPI